MFSVFGFAVAAGRYFDEETGAGKAGFITGLYVVIVPTMGCSSVIGQFSDGSGVALATVGSVVADFKQTDQQW